MDLYKKILNDKGSDSKNVLNKPLSYYLSEENESDEVYLSSGIVALNLGSLGRVDACIKKGSQFQVSSPSKFGKSLLALALCKDAQKKLSGPVIYINSEGKGAFSWPLCKSFGIDTSKEKFLLFEECSIEGVKNIICKIFEDLSKEEASNIFLVLDSFGALGSITSIDSAIEGKLTRNLYETQQKNQLAILLNSTKSTRFIVNHVYTSLNAYGNPLSIASGVKSYYLSDTVMLFSSRKKNKDENDEVNGFIINSLTHKSRASIENTEFKLLIEKDKGYCPWYGLLDDALEGGFVFKQHGKGFYRECVKDDIPLKESKIYTKEFWEPIFKNTDFKNYLEKKYQYTNAISLANSKENIDNMLEQSLTEEVENISEDTDEKTTKGRPRKKARLEVK